MKKDQNYINKYVGRIVNKGTAPDIVRTTFIA